MTNLVPIGTVVRLHNGTIDVKIIGRFPLYNQEGTIGYFDYVRLMKILEKIKDGKEPSEDDVKKIEEYKRRYTNRELPETVQVVLDKHKQAIEDKKLKAEVKEESEEEGIPFDIYQSIKSGILSGGVAFLSEFVKVKLQIRLLKK